MREEEGKAGGRLWRRRLPGNGEVAEAVGWDGALVTGLLGGPGGEGVERRGGRGWLGDDARRRG